jgi:hypothetical protein
VIVTVGGGKLVRKALLLPAYPYVTVTYRLGLDGRLSASNSSPYDWLLLLQVSSLGHKVL